MKNDRRHRIFAVWFTALTAALLTASCSLEDGAPDYRYRLTVEVETPEGLKSGSSVIEVTQSMGRSAGTGFGKQMSRRVRGEAVAVDLPDGQVLFALLRSDDLPDWSSNIMQWMAPKIEGEPWEEQFDNVLLLEGLKELPRRWSPSGPSNERSAYPMLVTFGEIEDPTSVARVEPDNLSVSFGEGVILRRITVKITDDPVTTGIEERLEWLPAVRGRIARLPIGERSPPGTPLPLYNTLTEMNFRTGFSR